MPLVLLAKVRFYPRYFGYFTPVILLLIARGAAYLAGAFGPRGRLRWVTLALLIALVATPSMVELSRYYTDVDKEQWRELTAVVEARYEPGDLVLVSAAAEMTLNPINWYTSIPREELARALFPKGGILTSLAQIEALPGVTEGYDRVWMVFVWQRPEITARIVDTMERSRSVTEAWSFVGLELMLFEGGP
jgi:hypothetical protein